MSGTSTVLQAQTIAPTDGAWTQTVTFAPFDTALGTLVGVGIVTTADVTGSVGVENLSPTAGTADVTQSGTINLYDASGDWLSNAVASVTTGVTLSAFDGAVDWTGASGAYRPNTSGSNAVTAYELPASFLGTSPVTLTVKGSTGVSESGPGNLEAFSYAGAGAVVSLQYVYIPTGSDAGSVGVVLGIAVDPFSLQITGSETTTPQTFVVPNATTGWTQALAVTRFNPALGTLEDVDITVSGSANEVFKLENLSPAAATVTASETTNFAISIPGSESGTIFSANATTGNVPLSAFDGTADFGGTSGTIETGPVATVNGTLLLVSSGDLALFTGTGTADLQIAASGTSDVSGPGDLFSQLLNSGGATVTVSYVYAPS
jgi:hypothetical protein